MQFSRLECFVKSIEGLSESLPLSSLNLSLTMLINHVVILHCNLIPISKIVSADLRFLW